MELVAPILLGVWVDQQFGWSPWGLVVGGTIGFVGSITHMMMLANRENKRKSG
jgi:ATP synthase protein I